MDINDVSFFLDFAFFVNWFFAVEAVVFLDWVRENNVFLEFKVVGFAGFRREFGVFVDPDAAFERWFHGGCFVFNKVLESGFTGMFGVRSEAGEAADLHADDVFWFFRPFVRFVFKDVSHDVVPDRGSAGNTGNNPGIHGRVVVVADPSGDEIGGGKAKGPVVSEVIGSTGFGRDSVIRND